MITMKKYKNSGDGFWYNKENPADGCAGMPEEIIREMERDFEEKLYIEIAEKLAIKSRAKELLEKSLHITNTEDKIAFLKEEIGYKKVKIKGGLVPLDKADEKYIHSMFQRTLNELIEIEKNNPSKYILNNNTINCKSKYSKENEP